MRRAGNGADVAMAGPLTGPGDSGAELQPHEDGMMGCHPRGDDQLADAHLAGLQVVVGPLAGVEAAGILGQIVAEGDHRQAEGALLEHAHDRIGLCWLEVLDALRPGDSSPAEADRGPEYVLERVGDDVRRRAADRQQQIRRMAETAGGDGVLRPLQAGNALVDGGN